jgi:hypothetical protein
MQMPIDPLNELRVKAGKDPVELTASHPFFWAGYVVIDSGWQPAPEEEPAQRQGDPPIAGEGEAPPEPPADAKPAGVAAPPPVPAPPGTK